MPHPEYFQNPPEVEMSAIEQGEIYSQHIKEWKKINKLIKPYIANRKDGYCTLLIPLREWDYLLVQMLQILQNGEK